MVFNSLTFLIFSVIFFPIYFFLKGKWRMAWCLIAGYVFYGWWDWRFLGLIAFSTVVDWQLANIISRTENPRRRKTMLVFSMVMNLGFLGIFKYFNFFVDSFSAMME